MMGIEDTPRHDQPNMLPVLAFLRRKAPDGAAFGLSPTADRRVWVATLDWIDAIHRPHNIGGTGETPAAAVERLIDEVPYYDEAPQRIGGTA